MGILKRIKLFLLFLIILLISTITAFSQAETNKEIYQNSKEIYTENQIYQVKVNKIILKGNKKIPTNTILNNITIKENSTITKYQIQESINKIYEMGFFSDIDINFQFITKDEVNIIVYLSENPEIKTIQFVGNKILSELDLIEVINSRPGKIINYNVIREDIIAINEEYNKMGFVGIKNHVKDLQIKENGTLIFYIQEAFYPKSVNITGNKVIDTQKLKKLILIKPNEPLKKEDVENTLNNIYQFYQEEGYLLADVRSEINEDNTINIQIYEAILEDIKIEGNTKTKSYVIEKMLELPKGKIINSFKLRRNLRKMQLGGYFKNVEPDFKGGSEPGKVIIILKVEEQQTGQAVLGVGFGGLPGSNRGGLAGSLSVSEINFKGKGQYLAASWERGNLINSVSLSFSDPYTLSNYYSYGFSLQSTELLNQQAIVNTTPQTIAIYKDYRRNYSLFFGRKIIEKDLSYNFNIAFLTFKTSPTPNEENPYVITPTKGNYISLGASITKDNRDDEFYPTRGTLASLNLDQAIRSSGNLNSFTKVSIDYRKYFNFKKERVLAVRTFLGLATSSTPFIYQYTLGGSDTLRGYDFNRFIGNRAFMVNIEYRIPINKKIENLYGAVFVDWGAAFLPNEKISLSKAGFDYGLGVRFVLPQFGSIRIDYAISNEKSKLVVGVGQMF
jgi:outer membrane protein insertion porin family